MLQNNDIKEKLKYKNFDERALNYIVNAIEEFDSLFGQYISKEKVVNMIRKNLDNFKLGYNMSSSEKGEIGSYLPYIKRIEISKNIDNDEEEIKSVVFHEMFHGITTDPEKLVTGFSKNIILDDFKVRQVTMHGFTEGVTAYATKIRDDKYSAKKIKNRSYPILTEQVENIVSLMGKDKFWDIAFNRPQDFIEEMREEYGDGLEFEELDDLFDAFDIIWKNEKNVQIQNKKINFIDELLNSSSNTKDTNEIKFAKNTIITTLEKILLTKPISTIEEFNEMYQTMKTYIKQLRGFDIKMYELLYDKLQDLQSGNDVVSKKIIEKIASEDFRIFAGQESYINSIKKLPLKEKLIKFSEPGTQKELSDYDFWGWNEYQSTQCAKLASTIIETDSESVNEELLYILINGLAKTILEKNWTLDKIGLDCIKLDSWRTIFNLYETNMGKKTYLGTYGLNDETEYEEYTVNVSYEKKKKILKEHPEFDNMLLLENQNGQFIGYAGNDKYIDEIGGTERVEHCKSKEERAVEKLKSKLDKFRNLKEMEQDDIEIPQIILDSELEQVKKEIEKLKQIDGENNTILERLERLSRDTSMQDVNEIIEEITTSKLGLEILDVEKDFKRLDEVEKIIKEHLKEQEQDLGKTNEKDNGETHD